ncbi:hypothetical protein G6O69_34465 [Pseudenhygromyxa sp. WMMC2535]|uniref:hypothetical protein n=1 Tax=Pseudenhygromyxa sp. WMMC2535 TaxID=2712867 RepID=UPI001558005A|nr:hypothetical protein [Pseudenhygromyxa sp. WMMC2535]NVB42977.1 hypothetical protein [Pseudenhygromyxa sp. WMMC2535]
MSTRAATLRLPIAALALLAACTPEGDEGGESNDQAEIGETLGEDADEAESTSEGADENADTLETTWGESAVPEFGATFTVIATAEDGLDVPRDLAFNPLAPEQLWTFNTLSHGAVIVFDPGTAQQSAEVRIDAYGQHFMAFVSSAAFGLNGNFATCQESRNEWNVGPQPPDDFMGPTLWPADLEIFAMVGQEFPPGAQEGSHLDMLHQSPLCMGIAFEQGNAYWAFDGFHGDIVRYDFQDDHGPGGGDHSDGIITRYVDVEVTRVDDIPGHMEYDPSSGLLYVADTGAGRIFALDTQTGVDIGPLPGEWDGATYTGVEGAQVHVLAEGLDRPSGLALHGGRLFVGEFGSADIVAFDLEGGELGRIHTPAGALMGLEIGPAGRLWYADGIAEEIVRVDP